MVTLQLSVRYVSPNTTEDCRNGWVDLYTDFYKTHTIEREKTISTDRQITYNTNRTCQSITLKSYSSDM